MRAADWILAAGSLALVGLLVSLIVTLVRPGIRLWPAGRSWWKLAWMSGLTVVATGAGLVLLLVDYGSGPLDDPGWILVGTVLVALGAGLTDWGIRTLGRRTSSGLTGRFSTRGPYRWTRNPQYVGDVLMALGIAIVADSWRVAILGAGGIACLLLAPLAEEKWLAEQYGEAFERYRRRVPRLLGRPAAKESDAPPGACPPPERSRDSARS